MSVCLADPHLRRGFPCQISSLFVDQRVYITLGSSSLMTPAIPDPLEAFARFGCRPGMWQRHAGRGPQVLEGFGWVRHGALQE